MAGATFSPPHENPAINSVSLWNSLWNKALYYYCRIIPDIFGDTSYIVEDCIAIGQVHYWMNICSFVVHHFRVKSETGC
jgi:hypothetical protein